MSRPVAGLAGLVVGALSLAAAELVAGFSSRWRSPLLDVGDRVIDGVPPRVKDVAIDLFGTNDKLALIVGIATILAVVAAFVVGIVGMRWRPLVGIVGIALFGVVGALAARNRRAATPWHVVVPSAVGALAGIAAFVAITRSGAITRHGAIAGSAAVDGPTDVDGEGEAASPPSRQLLGRRGVLIGALAVAAAPLAIAGRRLAGRFSAVDSRRAVRLPPAADSIGVPGDADLGVRGVAPFITPNADFYRIDTALTVPQMPTDEYTLRVTGRVDRQLTLSFDDLLHRPLVERPITLTCVSNEVGGNLVGTARWLGCRLDELLAEAGVHDDADQIVGRSVDGYTCGFPTGALDDGRDALVVVGMNGEPLPFEHGFPVRLVVPGLYGFVSATKWLTEIELTRFDDFDHYWARRGWAAEAPIKLMSRIDTPRGLARVAAGRTTIGGVAWAQTVGIAAVEVRIDDGDWQPATLGTVPSTDTWVQWRLDWEATPGRHSLVARATDRENSIQTDARSEPVPDGATGLHQIVVIVDG